MATRRTVLTQSERGFWREDFRDIHKTLVAKHGGRRKPDALAADAAIHADAAVEQLRKRATNWGNS